MCGIGGIIGPGISADQQESAALRLRAAILHRGPDDSGFHFSPDRLAALVHSRLSILDPGPKGHQPMVRGRHAITFNGEIYNFRELRATLSHENQQFETETDTEILLALYARHGANCLRLLRGMFAFAIWDKVERTCLLARDPFGIKPLYYTQTPAGDLAFASEVRALLATGLITRELDPIGVDSFLANGSVAEPFTLIKGVRCLEAGILSFGTKEKRACSGFRSKSCLFLRGERRGGGHPYGPAGIHAPSFSQ